MKSDQLIKELLKQQESEQLEFMEGVRKDAIGKTICSFLNNNGGQLLLGVTARKQLKHIANAAKVTKELEQYLVKEIIPEAAVMVSVEKVDKKDLILIKVWGGSKQPYVFGGTIYYRKGEDTVQASSKEISELIHNRQKTEIHWERQPALGVELEDLDLEEIQITMEKAITDNRIKESKKEPIDFLSYFGLYQNGYFTNAAVILFAKKPFRFLPQARVRVAYLQEGKGGAKYFDDQLLEGNLFKNIDSIQQFFDRHLSLSRSFNQKNWQRNDDYLFPMSALREGVMNALVHRDYSNSSGSVAILLYPDKLEITNTGKLPLPLTALKRNHLSMPVNPDIAHMVFLRGYIEKIGRGTLKILDACKEAGLKMPVWSKDSNSVKLTFFSKVKLQTPGGVEDNSAIRQLIDGVAKEVTDVVKARLIRIIEIVQVKPGTKTKDLVSELGVAERTIKENLKVLLDSGLVVYEGSKKAGGYFTGKKVQKKLS